jgi:hypothetical protein
MYFTVLHNNESLFTNLKIKYSQINYFAEHEELFAKIDDTFDIISFEKEMLDNINFQMLV